MRKGNTKMFDDFDIGPQIDEFESWYEYDDLFEEEIIEE